MSPLYYLFLMKYTCILPFALMLIIELPVSAQYYPDLHRLYYSNSAGEKGITTYIYNGKSLPCKAIWELEDGSRWSENLHTFDENGNMIRKTRTFSDSLTSENTCSYDGQGNLLEERFRRSDGFQSRVVYIFREDRCIKALCEKHQGWFSGEILYHYDPYGTQDSASLFAHKQYIGRITCHYNPSGQVEKEVWQLLQGFQQVFRYEYLDRDCIPWRSSNAFIQSSCRWRISAEEYDFNGENGGPSHYEYGEDGSLQKKTFTRKDGLQTITSYAYDTDGKLTGSRRLYNDGKTGNFSYRYDNEGRLVERVLRISAKISGTEHYHYDGSGKLVKAEWENFDNWLSGTLVFSHDRYDRIIGAEFSPGNPAEAHVEFSYNDHNLLEKIHWIFHGGHTQTYHFNYEKR